MSGYGEDDWLEAAYEERFEPIDNVIDAYWGDEQEEEGEDDET